MRTLEESRARWNTLFNSSEISSLVELKEALKSGENCNPCEDGLRSVCWKVFLLHKSFDRALWPAQLSDTRGAYTSLREHYLKYIERPNDLPSTSDPLAEDDESPWESLRQDESIRVEILQDVERCLQEMEFFQNSTNKAKMLDILFVFVKLHPDIGYRQGMHELLAHVLWVVSQDAITGESHDESMLAPGDASLLLQTLDPVYIEHDAFSLFCAIMQTAKLFYEHDDGKVMAGHPEVSSIVARSQYILNVVLREIDPHLADHFQAIEILPQIFLTRWLRLLFGREFQFQQVLAVWDLLVSESLRPGLVDLACVTMLLRIRWQLLESDYSSALALLLRYPSPESTKPLSFVLDALYLEQNMTPQGASHLISKYSGKPPALKRHPTSSSQATGGFASRQKAHPVIQNSNTRTSESGSPTRSLAMMNQKRLDSLFQDVSEGFQRRAEGWGVTKVVRGAVVEARRNIQNIQSSASSPGLLTADTITSDSPSPPHITFATIHELNARVSAMESRNKALADMLGKALVKLHSHHDGEQKQNDRKSTEEINRILTKIHRVQACLEDPSIPISEEAETNLINKSANRSNEITPKATTATTTTTASSATKTAPSTRSNDQTQDTDSKPPKDDKPSSNDTNTIKTAQPPTKLIKSTPVRPATRTPIRDSSLSWILGEDRSQSSFATCASSPPERRREVPTSLFGDSQGDERVKRKTDTEEDDNLVVLTKLHPPSR